MADIDYDRIVKGVVAGISKSESSAERLPYTEDDIKAKKALANRLEALKIAKMENALGVEKLKIEEKELENEVKIITLEKESGALDEEAYQRKLKHLKALQEELDKEKLKLEGQEKLIELTEKWEDKLEGVLKTFMAVSIEQYNALTTFAKSTGLADKYADSLANVGTENFSFSIQVLDAVRAQQALMGTFGGLNTLTQEANEDLVQLTAQMGALGVSEDITSRNLQVMANALGMTRGEIRQTSQEFQAMASAMSVSVSRIASDFEQMAKTLSKYDANAFKGIFTQIEGISAATGIAAPRLLELTAGMDKFSASAEAAGRLNAILGGNAISAMELLNATEEERLRMLLQAETAAGNYWENGDKFARQALASAAGFTDMAEAAAFFTTSVSDLDEQQRELAKMRPTQEAFNNAIREGAMLAQQWRNVWMTALAPYVKIMMKVLEAVSDLLQWLMKLNEQMGGYFLPILGLVVLVLGAVAFFLRRGYLISLMFGGGLKFLGFGAHYAAWGLKSLTTAMSGFGAVSGAFVTGIFVVVAALTVLGLTFAAIMAAMAAYRRAGATVAQAEAARARAMTEFIQVSTQVDDAAVERVTRLVDQSERFVEVNRRDRTESVITRFIERSRSEASARPVSNPRPIILQVRERTLASCILETIEDQQDVSFELG